MPEQYLTVAKAVEQFADRGVTEAKIRNWLRTGRIRRYQLEFDSTTMVLPSEIERVLKSLETVIPAEEDK